jgi:lipopolysaccharide biosynthesis glycosyltransferase
MISVIENNKDVQICFHNFISANLDEKIIKTIENKIASKLVTIKFYKISKYNIKQQSYITSAGFYRLYAPNLLPHLKRVLYLDDDIICLGDITELCNMKFQPQE